MKNKVNIQLLTSSPDYKVLSISGNAGDTLQKHKVNTSALLLVREGSIYYSEGSQQNLIQAGECVHIPAHITHEVYCNELAKFFVVMSNQTKMKFEK